jgi:putative transposase
MAASAKAVWSPRSAPARALGPAERETILARLHEERFQDRSPAAVYATLLDEGEYYCSIRTMYRLLAEHGEVRERRDQLTHPPYQKPELLATAPNQLWSWDITKLLGPAKWTYFYLYVILDLFSRYVTGWMVTLRESAELAKRLIEESCQKQGIRPGQLTLHADRGTSMTSKPVAFLLADLGVTKTHSRPHVSSDNPYSESQFRTLKYRPEFPDRFGCLEDSRAFCQGFFRWYNLEHRHSGLGFGAESCRIGKSSGTATRLRSLRIGCAAQQPARFLRRPLSIPSVSCWEFRTAADTRGRSTLVAQRLPICTTPAVRREWKKRSLPLLLLLWPRQRFVALRLPDTSRHLNHGRAMTCKMLVRVGVNQYASLHDLIAEIDPPRS